MFLGCAEENTGDEDNKGVIEWKKTTAGKTAKVKCPFGPNSAKAKRECTKNGTWGSPNYTACDTAQKLTTELEDLLKVLARTSKHSSMNEIRK